MAPPTVSQPGGVTRKRTHGDTSNLADVQIDFKKVPPYDPLKEESPNAVTLSSDWAAFIDGRAQIHNLVTAAFVNSTHNDKLTKSLENMANETLVDIKQEKIIICISGNMGGGKSATLNSLFNVGSIAREGCEGRSVTLASNMFAAPKMGQKEPYLAEVFFFNAEQRRDLLTGYLRDHFRMRHGLEEDGEGRGGGKDNSEENVTIENEVENCFYSLFRNHRECRSLEDVRSFLEDVEVEDDFKLINQVCNWTENLLREATCSSDSVIITASTPGDLTARLARYNTQVDADDGTSEAWLSPMVDLIKFHFNDPLTRHGMTFLDTPGLSDLSRTRRLSAIQHSRKKTHSLIVCDILRAQDDGSIATEVKAMNSLGPDRIVIVTTKVEVIGNTIPPGSKRDKDMVRRLQRDIAELQERRDKVDEELAACDDEDEEDDKVSARLSKDRRKLGILIKFADNAEQAHRIHMRNEHTNGELQKKLRHVSRSTRPVRIFNISNWIYMDHHGGFSPSVTPVLSVEETQIPQLRRTISTFQNEARLREVLHAQNVTIPGYLSRLLLYTSRSPVERKNELEVHVIKPLNKYAPAIELAFKHLGEGLQSVVLDPLKQSEGLWTEGAANLCGKWNSEFTNQKFLNLMIRSGHCRGTMKNRTVDLSAELIGIVTIHAQKLFSKAMQSINMFENTATDLLEEIFGVMTRGLQEDENFAFVDSDQFLNHLGRQKPILRHRVRASVGNILAGVEHVSNRTTFATDDAYVVLAMQSIYDHVCLLKFKKGSKVKAPPGGFPKFRKATFQQECTRPHGIWATACKDVEVAMAVLLQREMVTLTDEIGKAFKGFHDAFNLRCDAQAVAGPEEKMLQEELRVGVRRSMEVHEGMMQGAADGLYRDFHR